MIQRNNARKCISRIDSEKMFSETDKATGEFISMYMNMPALNLSDSILESHFANQSTWDELRGRSRGLYKSRKSMVSHWRVTK